MAQVNDGFEIQNASFPSVRADLNETFLAIATQNAGVNEPTKPVAYMFWLDISQPEPILKMRGASNTAWISLLKLVQNGGLMPPGTIIEYAGAGIPKGGYLRCDHSIYQAADYPLLFDEIGPIYNIGGEAAGEFRVPDRRKRVGIGATTGYPLGSMGGLEAVTLNESQLPSHSHGITDNGHSHSITDNGHSHGITDNGHRHDGSTILGVVANRDIPGLTGGGPYDIPTNVGEVSNSQTEISNQNGTTDIAINESQANLSIQLTGNGQPHTNMPPYVVCNYFIKF